MILNRRKRKQSSSIIRIVGEGRRFDFRLLNRSLYPISIIKQGRVCLMRSFPDSPLVLTHLIHLAVNVRRRLLTVGYTATDSKTSGTLEGFIIWICSHLELLIQLLQTEYSLTVRATNTSTALSTLRLATEMTGFDQTAFSYLFFCFLLLMITQ